MFFLDADLPACPCKSLTGALGVSFLNCNKRRVLCPLLRSSGKVTVVAEGGSFSEGGLTLFFIYLIKLRAFGSWRLKTLSFLEF